MRLFRIRREKDFIEYMNSDKGAMHNEDKAIKCPEAPMESFTEAMNQLATAAIEMMELPESWRPSIEMKQLQIKYSKRGTREVQITFMKSYLRTSDAKKEKTTYFYIEDGALGEEIVREAPENVVIVIEEMIHEAVLYIGGNREQTLLPIGGEPEDPVEPEDGDELDFNAQVEVVTDWNEYPVEYHPDTKIPAFMDMEKAHSYWLIGQYDDKAELKQDIEFNFDGKLDTRGSMSTVIKKARAFIEAL